MSPRRSGSALLGAVLALFALFGVIGVSSWHAASVHDDGHARVATADHDHGSPGRGDPDAPIHELAHATGQWIAIAGPVALSRVAPVADRIWSVGAARLAMGIEPSGLLRPPRG